MADSKRPVRRYVVGGLLVITLMVGSGITGAVYASHQFPDVSNTNPFHDDISWLADQGITTGYNDGTFRPTNPITRQAFAAMLRRYADGTEVVSDTSPYTNATVAYASVTCPTGKIVVGGGGASNGADMYLTASYPFGPVKANGWTVWFESDNNVARTGTVNAYAICQPKP